MRRIYRAFFILPSVFSTAFPYNYFPGWLSFLQTIIPANYLQTRFPQSVSLVQAPVFLFALTARKDVKGQPIAASGRQSYCMINESLIL